MITSVLLLPIKEKSVLALLAIILTQKCWNMPTLQTGYKLVQS